MYCILAALSIPIQGIVSLTIYFIIIVHPCRISIESFACTWRYFSPRVSGYTQLTDPDTFVGSPRQEGTRRYILSFVILVATYTFALAIPNLEEFLAFAGATGGVTMCFILPTLFYVIMSDFKNEKNSMIIALCISVFGVICGVAQVVALFISAHS